MERFFTKLDPREKISTYETENQEKSYSTESMTPDEMAVLCGEDGDGWLLTSHMVYLLNKMTVTQDTCRTLLFCLNAVNASLRMNQLRDRYNNFQEIDQLVV